MILFKLIFWYCIVTNNTFFLNKLCQFDIVYNLVKYELQDSGYFDESNVPNKEYIISNTKYAFYNIKGMDLPHYSYVYKYGIRMNETTIYYPIIMFIDKFMVTVENKIIYSMPGYELQYWENVKTYLKKSRFIYDKLDDVSRTTFPLWQKRIFLSQVKTALNSDNYDDLDSFPAIPLHAFIKID